MLIQIFRDIRKIKGNSRIKVPVITKKVCRRLKPIKKKAIINAATATATPTA